MEQNQGWLSAAGRAVRLTEEIVVVLRRRDEEADACFAALLTLLVGCAVAGLGLREDAFIEACRSAHRRASETIPQPPVGRA